MVIPWKINILYEWKSDEIVYIINWLFVKWVLFYIDYHNKNNLVLRIILKMNWFYVDFSSQNEWW